MLMVREGTAVNKKQNKQKGQNKRTKEKTKSTKVQTLGELRMRDTANGWAGGLAFTRGLPLVARGESDTG